ncbi:MAG: hypothetical protein V4550_14675 [Gemmatimonadota bacterium]
MIASRSLVLGAVALLASVSALSARPAVLAGPPWISIETPVNPYDATTRGAFLLVHAFHHGTDINAPVTGTAEGLVNGARRSVVLDFTATSRTGAYALRKQWADSGLWTLVIKVQQDQHGDDAAQAIVELAADGSVARIQVPTRPSDRGDMPLPRQLSSREIDASLRARATR